MRQKILKTDINFINPPRKGKRLLVLDIDYTIFDCKVCSADIVWVNVPMHMRIVLCVCSCAPHVCITVCVLVCVLSLVARWSG